MKPALAKSIRMLEGVSEGVGRLIAWLTLAMVVVMFAVVVMRYAFDFGRIYIQEAVTWMHALVFMLGAGYTLKHDAHVRVDIFYRRLSPRGRAWVDLLGTLVLLLPVTGFLFVVSWDYVLSSWQVQEGSREAGGLGAVFLLKSALLIMPVLLILQGLAHALRCLAQLADRPAE